MSFKEKVKALLEGGEGKRGKRPGGKGKSRVVGQFKLYTTAEKKGEKLRSKINKLISKELGPKKSTIANAQHNGHAAKPKKSQTENSNHPFYQKVKALSRGKKNNSLLERKSKIIKVLIARIKPCEKKSKMDEEKKKSKKKHWEPSFGLSMDDQEAIKKAVAAEHEAFIQSEKKRKEKSKKGKAKSKKGKQDADDYRPKDLEDPGHAAYHEGKPPKNKPPQRLAPRYRRSEPEEKPPPITGNTIEVTRAIIARRHKKK